jgi:hypothetical protein
VGHAELAAPFFAIGVQIDADDLARARQPRALDHVQADAAQAGHRFYQLGRHPLRSAECAMFECDGTPNRHAKSARFVGGDSHVARAHRNKPIYCAYLAHRLH